MKGVGHTFLMGGIGHPVAGSGHSVSKVRTALPVAASERDSFQLHAYVHYWQIPLAGSVKT